MGVKCVLLVGNPQRLEEMKRKLEGNDQLEIEISNGGDEDYNTYDLIMDLNFDDDPGQLDIYARLKNKPVIVGAVKHQLSELLYIYNEPIQCKLFGLNTLPTFMDRTKWEMSLLHKPQAEDLQSLMQELKIDYHLVEDRVGMVTPRIVFMIINEACFTLQEGTATIEDIDLGMKLGTNYPQGPFEWADKIGITDVYETLAALYEDTKDERYKICPIIKTNYLRNRPFIKS